MSSKKTTVVDIGARYGLHPTWKNFSGAVEFHLIDADPVEAQRLEKRYKDKKNVFIYDHLIAEKSGNKALNILANPAMSGSVVRRSISPLFWAERKDQLKICETVEVEAVSLNDFRQKLDLEIHYLKLDTEGTEFSILNSFEYFSEINAIRSEVCFDNLFDNVGGDTFTKIHNLLSDKNFILLNLDYDGRGDYFSKFISPSMRYGILQACDAVWIKKPELIIEESQPHNYFTFLNFLFLNNAPDLALHLIEEHIKKFISTSASSEQLFCQRLVIDHLRQLKWLPGQSEEEYSKFYQKHFNEEFPSVNKYNENELFNPMDVH